MPRTSQEARRARRQRLTGYKQRLRDATRRSGIRSAPLRLQAALPESFESPAALKAVLAAGVALQQRNAVDLQSLGANRAYGSAAASFESAVASGAIGLTASMMVNAQAQLDVVNEMTDQMDDMRGAVVARMAADARAFVLQVGQRTTVLTAEKQLAFAALAAQQSEFSAQEAALNAQLAAAMAAGNAAEAARLQTAAAAVRAAAQAGAHVADAAVQARLDDFIQKQNDLKALIADIQTLAAQLDSDLQIAMKQIGDLIDKLRAKFPDKFPPSPPFYVYTCPCCGNSTTSDLSALNGGRAQGCAAETSLYAWMHNPAQKQLSLPPNMVCFDLASFQECLERKLAGSGVKLALPPQLPGGWTTYGQRQPFTVLNVGEGPNNDMWTGPKGQGQLRKAVLKSAGNLELALKECLQEIAAQMAAILQTPP